ncbi:TonB-dependent siderophore receptor [Azonexus hydrophilus]|uniref:TonB-dependent siderophore receptor n=1 Tax=Azonexus hydrophilus TaxID=418702 RepID=A0A1R1I5F0_9RHOO|nr:TonB-dependent siderophore receptor [Azonexus hydrophilus]OMG53945.1 TonB-dependent siderophore receptor [Azonexus hydrophilus]
MKRKASAAIFPASFRTTRVVSPSMTKTSIALGISTAMLAPASLLADESAKEAEMDPVTVVERVIDHNPYAEPDAPYKARISGDERRKRPLAETPATINVLTKTQIEDSGYTDLRDILDTQPGITLGTGENGNAFGDRYIIRGQEARSDVFVDGLRDPGMSIRESFAVEQVEVSKGPNSSFAGRGTVGGAINSITKQATTDYDFTKLSVGLGTDDHRRVTVDTNYALTDTVALRANVLYGYEDVPDRAPADRERKGVALSALIKPTDRLDIVLDYYGFRGEDRPDMGSYLYGTVPNRKPFKNAPVYAQDNDFLKSEVDTLTARLKYRFNDQVRITNATRWGKSENGYVATGAGYVSDTTLRLSTHQGWQEVDYFANQTNLFVDTEIAGMKHEWNFGLEYTDHAVLNGIYSINGITATNQPSANNVAFANVDGAIDHSNIRKFNWDQDWRAKAISASIMDTVDLSDKWTAFAGLRYDRTRISLKTQTAATGVLTGDYSYSESMWNGHVGVTYKFLPDANVYLTYSTAKDLNGGESDVGTSGGYGGLITLNGQVAGAKPEKTENVELGTKWNLMGGKLLATAAVFQITKTDVMEASGYTSTGTFNSAANRVRGIEFGLAGNITDKLSAFAGLTLMDAEVTKSANSNHKGKTLSNFADKSASAQLRYQLTPVFAFGTAVKYESKKYAGEPDTAASYNAAGQYSQPIPAYTVWDLFADYRLNKAAKLRVNVGNVFDKDYYLAGYRSGSFLYKGDARNARVTLNYEF